MNLFKLLNKTAIPKIFIPAFLVTFILQGFMLGVINPKILSITGGLNPLDLELGFSLDYASKFLHSLGENGRAIYLNQFLFTDWFFSVISGVTWALFLTWLFKKSFPANAAIQKVGVIPIFITLFDYIENICAVLLTKSHPVINPWIGDTGSIAGVIKMILFYITLMQVLFLTGVLIRNKILKKRTTND